MKHIEERKKKIAGFLAGDKYIPMTLEELCVVLDVPDRDIREFETLMQDMLEAHIIRLSKNNRYMLNKEMEVHKGTIQGTAKRFSFFIPDDKSKEDIFIAPDKINGAMHGDSVLLKVVSGNPGDNRMRGEVVQVLNKQRDEILGVVEISRAALTVVPYDKRVGQIRIEADDPGNYRNGDVVAVDIVSPPTMRVMATGKIIEIVAKKNDVRSYFKYITRMYGYETEYPEDAVSEAKNISESDNKHGMGERKDYRNLLTVTIDGEDAKDLDDAISIKKTPSGNFILGVHIADVSHYVRENSELDKEAASRATSVYMVDRVIPMLPEVLSNGLCSLNPNEDKFAFSVMMEVNSSGTVTDFDISESIINSNERMTYKNVHKILNDNDQKLKSRYEYLLPQFAMMRTLSKILRDKRHRRGSIDFDFKESKIIMGPDGEPADVTKYDTTEANHIIEEFMLLCNETVAENFGWGDFPFIFRVHDKPDPDKMSDLNTFLKSIGYGLKSPGNVHPAELQKLVALVKGRPVEHLVNTVVLRSLKKAIYSPVNSGHFGLSSEHYCHFTSPIRRYPDLMIHRLIKKKLNMGEYKIPVSARDMEILAAHVYSVAQSSSELERKAEKAERDLMDYYKAVYMQKHIGDTFTGVVSGVTGFGMFVELENTVEGLVKVENLDGYYIFNRDNHELYMKNGPGRYTIGSIVKVKVVSVNVNMGEVDMIIAGSDNRDVRPKKSYHNPKRSNASYNKKKPAGKSGQRKKRR